LFPDLFQQHSGWPAPRAGMRLRRQRTTASRPGRYESAFDLMTADSGTDSAAARPVATTSCKLLLHDKRYSCKACIIRYPMTGVRACGCGAVDLINRRAPFTRKDGGTARSCRRPYRQAGWPAILSGGKKGRRSSRIGLASPTRCWTRATGTSAAAYGCRTGGRRPCSAMDGRGSRPGSDTAPAPALCVTQLDGRAVPKLVHSG
jgi:hypothetical protein